MVKNRWLIALSGVGVHICIGSVYAWSVFSKPLQATYGWSLKETNFTFGLAVFVLGVSAAIMGHVVEHKGPRFSGLVSTFLWVFGLLGASYATSSYIPSEEWRIWILYFSYGVVGGFGLGTGYVTPVSTLMKWFPDHRGLATGMAIMGFGFASFFGAPLIGGLIIKVGISQTFLCLAALYLVIMTLSSLYLEPPPEGSLPKAYVKQLATKKSKHIDIMPMNANEAIKTLPFYGLWIMMFINISCGIAIISVASPMVQEFTGLGAMAAAAIVGMNGLFNGLGRISWASLSDYLGRANTFILFFVIEIVAFWTLPEIKEILLFHTLLYLIMSCYGGGFATLPAYIGDIFGTQQVSAIHGYVLTAWALAGISGSTLASFLRDQSGSYAEMLHVFALIFLLALLVSIVMSVFVRKARKKHMAALRD